MLNRLLSVAAVVLAAVALAVVLFGNPAGSGTPESPPPAESDDARVDRLGEGSDVESRIASLEMTVSHLIRRLEALEKAQPAAAGTAGGAPTAPADADERRQLEALRSDVDALLTGDALGTDAGRQRLKEVVRSIQDEVFAERAQQRSQAREQARAERIKKFVQEARLSSSQEQDVVKLLDEESQQRRALREQLRAGGLEGAERRDVRAETRQLRARTDESARRILTAEQVELYEAMRREDSGDRGGGARGGQGGRANRDGAGGVQPPR